MFEQEKEDVGSFTGKSLLGLCECVCVYTCVCVRKKSGIFFSQIFNRAGGVNTECVNVALLFSVLHTFCCNCHNCSINFKHVMPAFKPKLQIRALAVSPAVASVFKLNIRGIAVEARAHRHTWS